MLNWSFSFITRIMNQPALIYSALFVASMNELVQIMISLIFGRKARMRGGAFYGG